jgi:hypothetical protein
MSRNLIILIALGILVLGAAAYLIFGKANTDPILSANGAPASAAEQSFLNLTAQLNPVNFDTSILDDPRFRALVNLETAILPENVGRTDPFSPLSGIREEE